MSRKEGKWRKSLQRMLELITIYHNIKSLGYDYRDIKITFTRALPNNEAEQVETLTKLSGIVSHRTLLSQLDFIEDPDHELELIAKEKQEYMNQMNMYDNHEHNTELSTVGHEMSKDQEDK